MIIFEETKCTQAIVHETGNKSREEDMILSKRLLEFSPEIEDLLLKYFLSSFDPDEYFNLYHDSDLKLNEVFTYVSEIFANPGSLFEQSQNLAKYLYEQTNHPKIKSGEFYVAYFTDCIVDGERVDAVGLFKSETKDTFLKVHRQGDGFRIESDAGININKLDKGCIIYQTEPEKGYLVSVVDTANKGAEAQYWVEHFLHVRPRNDEYFLTRNALHLCKDFVVKTLPGQFEVTKAEQADLLNKSVRFFKENDNFDLDDFMNEVIQEPETIRSFKQHKSEYEQDHDMIIEDNFSISGPAVKKQSRVFKSVIKLDKNFHIYVHGDHQKIIKGFDEETGMNYYQLFFKEES